MGLAVLSDAPAVQAWQRLYQLSLQHVFRPVITFDDTGERKPSPKGFRRVLEALNLTADEVLMVGDWPDRDMIGAQGVGIRTVFARYGDTFGTVESGADFEIDLRPGGAMTWSGPGMDGKPTRYVTGEVVRVEGHDCSSIGSGWGTAPTSPTW